MAVLWLKLKQVLLFLLENSMDNDFDDKEV